MATLYQDPSNEQSGARIPGMKEPGADHPLTIAPFKGRVRVTFNGKVVADSQRAMKLQEASYPPVYYIPREDADLSVYHPSETQTHCPYKGQASYFTLDVEGRRVADAVWSYENAYPAAARITGHLAFYPDRVDRIEATED
jgi:uncharacterized protein (DUF427 family)